MTNKKQEKMALTVANLPEDIYDVFFEYSKKRALTPFVVSLYRNSSAFDKILKRLDEIEVMITKISGVTSVKEFNLKNEDEIQEGSAINTISIDSINSKIDENDILGDEVDF